RRVLDDSKERMQILKENQVTQLSGKEAYHLLNDTDKGVFSKLYGSWAGTIHTSAYFPKDLNAWIALGGDQNPTVIHFSNWLKGDDLPYEKIEGKVDTDIPFVNMEPADWYQSKG